MTNIEARVVMQQGYLRRKLIVALAEIIDDAPHESMILIDQLVDSCVEIIRKREGLCEVAYSGVSA